ncbi:ferroxidase HEPHL1-like isoform X1 [Ictalurus furcatus]|uniref:ferroxidase HEPHL1-like isoform X1 n=1 Tax=Ictalurus furcatus TaxID=66913 RepID=UPI0023506B47|nr:ferroxidase HEPHL1-like isoform X1 [Ictalurus furcatus]
MDFHINRWYLFSLISFCTLVGQNEGITRTFFIGIREENWDYAPGGYNHITGKPFTQDEHASLFLLQGPHRIGHVYKKAVYRQYTDATYTQEILKPTWLGYLGPVIRAEAEDVIVIHLKNFASRRYSIHPHGVHYEKDSEGALYPDGTSGAKKQDDNVPPGGNYTYRWTVKPEFAPTQGDPNCLTWAYHSHVIAFKDISSGLIGALLTCKKGILQPVSEVNYSQVSSVFTNSQVRRTDVDKDFLLLFTVVNENLSWYLDENIQTFCLDPANVIPSDPDFKRSNQINAINGYVYGNLPGIEMCQNKKVSWHFIGMGNEVDIHSAYFHGQTLLIQGHRVDSVSLFPASFMTAEMEPLTLGRWLLNCQVNSHMQDGMQALFNVSLCAGETNSLIPLNGTVRKYFIAAELVRWNYAPSGIDSLTNLSLTENKRHSELYFGKGNGHLGGEYTKVVYRAYTDETFAEKSSTDAHLGILGPVLRAEVGDTLQVTFLNKADRNYSVQPHGLQYTKSSEGAQYEDDTEKNGSHVKPGDSFNYTWYVREGPSKTDQDCISYLYFSSSDPIRDTNSGLFGPLLVCKRGTLSTNNTQKNVDKEFFLLFTMMDENLSWYLKKNIQTYGTNESDPENEGFQESNKMHAVNGYMYGNLPGLEMCVSERVRWHVLGLGTDVDMHGIYFQGNTFSRDGITRDTLAVFPHTAVRVFMQPNTTGLFEVSCKVSDHYMGGMRQQYRVKNCGQNLSALPSAPTAHYYISAEELEWDYSPNRTWELHLFNVTEENSPGSVFVGTGENRLGSKYKKVVYREYTDATFSTRKQRQSSEKHLEILGPIIRAEVGEVLHITFLNKASRPYSIQPHGVKTSPQNPKPVLPGNMSMYQWIVPESSGPGVADPNCITFAYYSTVDFIKDTVSGLIGPLVICRKGILNQRRQRLDVDREFALLFFIFDENMSWYLEQNIQTYYNSSKPPIRNDDFVESNKMHAINGKVYGNLQGVEMRQGEKANWYLLGLGSEVDLHTVHLHGQTFIYKTDLPHRADVFDLIPGTFQTLEIVADTEGTWLLHCHLDDHILAGMETTYIIKRSGASAVTHHLGVVTILAFISTLGLK